MQKDSCYVEPQIPAGVLGVQLTKGLFSLILQVIVCLVMFSPMYYRNLFIPRSFFFSIPDIVSCLFEAVLRMALPASISLISVLPLLLRATLGFQVLFLSLFLHSGWTLYLVTAHIMFYSASGGLPVFPAPFVEPRWLQLCVFTSSYIPLVCMCIFTAVPCFSLPVALLYSLRSDIFPTLALLSQFTVLWDGLRASI